jgi:hypothetical protein
MWNFQNVKSEPSDHGFTHQGHTIVIWVHLRGIWDRDYQRPMQGHIRPI